jgi:Domain of unknown function (DUF4276)
VKQLRVAAIVEGHGEYESIRLLLTRIWHDMLGGEWIDVLQPIRQKRHKLAKQSELEKAVQLAALKLANVPGATMPSVILILVDADEDLPCHLAPELLNWAKAARSDVDIMCVVANIHYETWFVAAAESLRDFLNLPADMEAPDAPEQQRLGKGWIKKHFKGTYSETQDQASMTARMDMAMCRARSPSFDKLCRELAIRLER